MLGISIRKGDLISDTIKQSVFIQVNVLSTFFSQFSGIHHDSGVQKLSSTFKITLFWYVSYDSRVLTNMKAYCIHTKQYHGLFTSVDRLTLATSSDL